MLTSFAFPSSILLALGAAQAPQREPLAAASPRADLHALRVTVVETFGHVAVRPEPEVFAGPDPTDWPAGPRLVVERAPRERFADLFARVSGSAGATGTFEYEGLQPGTYVVTLYGGDVALQSAEVVVAADARTSAVAITAKRAPERGQLVVDLYGEDRARPSNVAVRVEDPSTGVELFAREDFEQSSSARFSLPAGRYRVISEGRPWLDVMHGRLMDARALGRVEHDIEVFAGDETRVEATIPRGSRVNVLVKTSSDARDYEAASKPGWFGCPTEDEPAPLVGVELRREGRAPLPVDFRWELKGSSAAGTHVRSAIPPGALQTSEVIPAGRFTLVARTAGGRTAKREVVLVDGETLDVELAIE